MGIPENIKALTCRLALRITNRYPFLVPKNQGGVHHFVFSVALMYLALRVRLAIAPVEAGLQYVTFFPAITLAAIVGGIRAGLLATIIGLVFATYIFTPPYYSFSIEVLQTAFWSNMVFLMDGIIVSFSIEAMHRYRQQLAQELIKSTSKNTVLEETDRRKSEFLAMLAHELRNPLAPICNAAQILKTADTDLARLTWCSDVIDRQAERLVRLVDDLLDVSRINRNQIELKKESLNVRDFIHPAIESSQPLIDARRQNFFLALPPEPLWVEGDRIRLTQVVSNLINNAAKYTQEQGHIGLSVKLSGEDVCIHVSDNGCGIDPAALSSLFELFYQVEHSLDRSQGGLGIGLSLVRNLVAMHDGNVQAFSEGLGKGSEFVVRLPRLIRAEPSHACIITLTNLTQ